MPYTCIKGDMGSLTCARIWLRAVHVHTGGYGIFNMRTNLAACRTHAYRESGTHTSAQKLTRRDRKAVPHPAPPRGIELGLFGFGNVIGTVSTLDPYLQVLKNPKAVCSAAEPCHLYSCLLCYFVKFGQKHGPVPSCVSPFLI